MIVKQLLSKSEDAAASIRRPPLLDWRMAGSVCRRLRKIGEVAFRTSKTFVLNLNTAKALRHLRLSCLSIEEQQTALSCLNSMILVAFDLSSPSFFIALSNCVAAFSALKHLDFYLGDAKGRSI